MVSSCLGLFLNTTEIENWCLEEGLNENSDVIVINSEMNVNTNAGSLLSTRNGPTPSPPSTRHLLFRAIYFKCRREPFFYIIKKGFILALELQKSLRLGVRVYGLDVRFRAYRLGL